MFLGLIRDLCSEYNKNSALSEASLKHQDLPVAISQGALQPSDKDASDESWPRQQRRWEKNWLVFFQRLLGKTNYPSCLCFFGDSKLPVDRALNSEFPLKVSLNWALARSMRITQGFFPS